MSRGGLGGGGWAVIIRGAGGKRQGGAGLGGAGRDKVWWVWAGLTGTAWGKAGWDGREGPGRTRCCGTGWDMGGG